MQVSLPAWFVFSQVSFCIWFWFFKSFNGKLPAQAAAIYQGELKQVMARSKVWQRDSIGNLARVGQGNQLPAHQVGDGCHGNSVGI